MKFCRLSCYHKEINEHFWRCCSPSGYWITIQKAFLRKSKLDFSRWNTIVNTRFWATQSICKVWSCYVQPFRRRYIYKRVHYFTFDHDLRSRTNTKRCLVSSTSYDLCTCKVWSCYVQRFRRKCIYKKYLIWPWPKVTWSIDLYIMWPMYLQSLKLLRPMVKEMHYQENTLFDQVTQNVAQYPRLHATYASAKFDVATSNG